ncbi:MAG: peptide chain release factor N(5)-glutamine methyltransferase [Puniceicoccales bacterium]|jgi:release factor glutamine methyltransferase|nr:peptide chain release factor N(5)-glutamine methyltransferase [Puniceicoccales bacterium]
MASIIELLSEATAFLHFKGIEQPKWDGECLLAHVLKCSPLELHLRCKEVISFSDADYFQKLLRRRGKREPLQYILGEVDFFNVKLKVDSRVLIPRHETEYLVAWLVDDIKERYLNNKFGNKESVPSLSKLHILDLGTGSGAIGIALGKSFPESWVTAVDQSPLALEVARENGQKNQVKNLQFLASDWYNIFEVHEALQALRQERFDIIVSNPPYLSQREWDEAQDEIRRYEPATALIAGDEGFDAIEIILQGAPKFLKKNGMIAIETGILHPQRLREKYKNLFRRTKILQDLNKFDRFFIAEL